MRVFPEVTQQEQFDVLCSEVGVARVTEEAV